MEPDVLAFVGLAAVVILETILSGTWNRWYFTVGVPLYRARVPRPPQASMPTAAELENGLKKGWSTPLVFHQIADGSVGFRERFFGGGFFFHYTPVMHGVIRMNVTEGTAEISGLMNWFVAAFVIFFGYTSAGELGGAALIPLIVIALLYLIQLARFRKVAAYVAASIGRASTA